MEHISRQARAEVKLHALAEYHGAKFDGKARMSLTDFASTQVEVNLRLMEIVGLLFGLELERDV